ncbi:hypothetical protein [Myroides odoratimimus]|uniref:hypothetical protein n=1 Tax=Myroides odoratimimus TaxID=76832 RepID=UPI0031012544
MEENGKKWSFWAFLGKKWNFFPFLQISILHRPTFALIHNLIKDQTNKNNNHPTFKKLSIIKQRTTTPRSLTFKTKHIMTLIKSILLIIH